MDPIESLRRSPTRSALLAAICLVAIANGFIASPYSDSVAYLLYLLLGKSEIASSLLSLFGRRSAILNSVSSNLAPVIITAMTLAVAGIPAAIYERIRGLTFSSAASLSIWLAATVLLSLPVLLSLFGEG
ncbi:MAG TPA: hypothetical protein VG900_10400 [Hyphomicrobiaceae bacterium]|nr:hypothetical protein [Hyphomicrobiaceae bacterium]